MALSMVLGFGIVTVSSRAVPVQEQEIMTTLVGTSVNVSDPGNPVRIEIFRWSTEAERQALVDSMAPLPPPPPPDPDAGRGGRGGFGGRGGRGRGAPEEPPDPITRLTTAISESPTVGYVWTDEVAGYSIKYAHRVTEPNGDERWILALGRRLGKYTGKWDPVDASDETEYDFTLLELDLDSERRGAGRASLGTEVIVDDALGSVVLAASAPPVVAEIQPQ